LRYLLKFTLIALLCFCCSEGIKTPIKDAKGNPNELINETSPYLLQHAYNPVDWKAWNEKTFDLAKSQDKLVIISIGYSACHWCHVMEEESFENDSIAKLMNEKFISIKVDREERPDVDQIYMDAVQLMTGRGGWPLNCITLPDGRPVFGGTYFTKSQWEKALEEISTLYENKPEEVIAYAERLTEGIKEAQLITLNTNEANFDKEFLNSALDEWYPSLDLKLGGAKGSPKFPMPTNLSFLMRYAFQNENTSLSNYVFNTLDNMAMGGIYDHIGGGFSRYSTDDKWHIPHFEKMLYDNAQLVSLYSDAYSINTNKLYKNVVFETLDFVQRELTDENGGFYSALDADSMNAQKKLEEGIFYSWTKPELKDLLGEDYQLFSEYYNVNSYGKWEKDAYVLIRSISNEDFAKKYNLGLDQLYEKIAAWKTTLFKARINKPRPRTDDKILTSWNALMLKSYLNAYRIFRDTKFLKSAIKNANFIEAKLRKKDGGLYHNYKDGKTGVEGFLDDYALTIEAYIGLYRNTLNAVWLEKANALLRYSISNFYDDGSGMFFYTSNTKSNLIARKIEVFDNVIASSNSIMANNLFILGHLYLDAEYSSKATTMLNNVKSSIKSAPSANSNWMQLYMNYSNPFYEIAVMGKSAKKQTEYINQLYIPNVLISGSNSESDIPLLQGKYNSDDTYIYVCVDSACKLPVTDVETALLQLKLK